MKPHWKVPHICDVNCPHQIPKAAVGWDGKVIEILGEIARNSEQNRGQLSSSFLEGCEAKLTQAHREGVESIEGAAYEAGLAEGRIEGLKRRLGILNEQGIGSKNEKFRNALDAIQREILEEGKANTSN